MKTYVFDCKGNNAPAYGCSAPGDNSGEYIKLGDLKKYLKDGLDNLQDAATIPSLPNFPAPREIIGAISILEEILDKLERES